MDRATAVCSATSPTGRSLHHKVDCFRTCGGCFAPPIFFIEHVYGTRRVALKASMPRYGVECRRWIGASRYRMTALVPDCAMFSEITLQPWLPLGSPSDADHSSVISADHRFGCSVNLPSCNLHREVKAIERNSFRHVFNFQAAEKPA